jgi:sugar lactone lactonase YvrE
MPSFGGPSLGLPTTPKLDVSFKGSVLSQTLTPALDLGSLSLSMNERTSQGKPYRPVFAVRTPDDGSWELRMPFGLAMLPEGGFYVLGWVTADGPVRLQEFDAAGQWVRSVRDFSEGAAADELDAPAGLAADDQRNVYVVDLGSSAVKKFDADGKLLSSFGQEGSGPKDLSGPRRVAVAPGGKFAVADAGNNRVVLWDQNGNCSLVLGINEPDDTGWMPSGDGPGELDDPQGVAVDAQGNIYVADTGNHRIQKFDPAGQSLLAFGTFGEAAGEFSYPQTVRISKADDVYVTDTSGSRVQKFDSEGRFIYQIFIPESAGSIDDLEIDAEGRMLAAFRKANLVLLIEVQ